MSVIKLGSNNIGNEGTEALRYNNTLKELYLDSNHINNAKAIFSSGNWSLTVLDLSFNKITLTSNLTIN